MCVEEGEILETDDYVECSGQLVLECKKCGEHLILLGLEDDWRLQATSFECGCGEKLTLSDRRHDAALRARHLFRSNLDDSSNWGTRN